MVKIANQVISGLSLVDIQKEAKQGDERAVCTFLDVMDPIIEGTARKFACPGSFNYDALIQDGRVAAVNALEHWVPEKGSLKAYVRKSVTNGVYKVGRLSKRVRLRERSLFGDEESLDVFQMEVSDEGLEEFERQDALPVIKARVREWVRGLSASKRKIIELIFYRGMNQSQAARLMGISRARVGQILKEIAKCGRFALAELSCLN